MKDRNNPAAEYSVALKPASQEEAGLFYSDEKQDEVLGTVGHLRIDFGSGGKSFWSTWWPHNADQLITPEFKRELQHTVDTLRRDGPLQSLTAMSSYCWKHGGEISKNDRVYGYIAETEHYRFCLRCTPRPGEYQGYLYCYDLRQQRMQQQDQLVGRVTYVRVSHLEASLLLGWSYAAEQRKCREEENHQDQPGRRLYQTLTGAMCSLCHSCQAVPGTS